MSQREQSKVERERRGKASALDEQVLNESVNLFLNCIISNKKGVLIQPSTGYIVITEYLPGKYQAVQYYVLLMNIFF